MSSYPTRHGPPWMSEPIAVCPTHDQAIHWRCRACAVNKCRLCLDEVAGGHLVCQDCGEVIAKIR